MIISAYNDRNFKKLEDKMGVDFRNKDFLVQALVHRSYLNENRDFPLAHNERMEFLGDAVLELAVTKYLFDNYRNQEGELTNWRAALVNANMCAEVANDIGLEEYLFLSHGESKDAGTKAREYILANVTEAMIGAVYLDQGWEIAEKFIKRWIISKLQEVLELSLWMDPKSRFQESAQEIEGVTPNYKVVKEEGPDHNKIFVVAVYLDKKKVAEGSGMSKQEAQVDAAEKALQIMKWKGPKIEIIKRKPSDPVG